MEATPKLLTSECAAHYPCLWTLIEYVAHPKTVRKYPIMLDMITFCQMFQQWLFVTTDSMGELLDLTPPNHIAQPEYGANPLVELRLDFLSDHVGKLLKYHEDTATLIIYDLIYWRDQILTRTSGEFFPEYNARRKCPNCKTHAVMCYDESAFCVNQACFYGWAL